MIGTGYVGLVSGACFAEFGPDVVCVDVEASKIERLCRGEIPIYEPGLDALVAKGLESGRLEFTTDLTGAVADADAVFIAVGTPSRRGDGHADLRFVEAAAVEIAKALRGYTVVVTKSTVPVGTGRRVAEIIRETNPDADFDVASNPEFLREGSAIGDFMRPDRVIIGAESVRAREVMRELYRPLYLMETPVVLTNLETAELTKYAANAFLATKITFINEMADLCEKVGANVQDVARGMGLDGRIGKKFLHAGPGYGGSCFPKDTLALVRTAQESGAPARLVEAVVQVNERRKGVMASRVMQACGGSVRGKTVGVLGVSFKPNTDDMREAPSLSIIPALQDAGATVRAYDPAAMKEAGPLLPGVEWCSDAYDSATDADVLVLNYRLDTPARLGLDYETISAINPQIVYVRNTAFGPEGPRAKDPGYDNILQAGTGMMASWGRIVDDMPSYMMLPIADTVTAPIIAWAVTTGLFARSNIGKGQLVDTSLLATSMFLQATQVLNVRRLDDEWRDEVRAGIAEARKSEMTFPEMAEAVEKLREREHKFDMSGNIYSRTYQCRDGFVCTGASSTALRAKVQEAVALLDRAATTLPGALDEVPVERQVDVQQAITLTDEALAAQSGGQLPGNATANALRAIISSGVDDPVVADAQVLLGPAENYGGRISFRYVAPLALIIIGIFGFLYMQDRRAGGYRAERLATERQGIEPEWAGTSAPEQAAPTARGPG